MRVLAIFRKHVERFRHYDRMTKMSGILRRYFVMNAFDGALTIFGVLVGAYFANLEDADSIIKLGLATAAAVGVSGFTGTFFIESAERKSELRNIESTIHRKLEKTEIHHAYKYAATLAALVDGTSTLFASLVILSPFFFGTMVAPIETLYYSSFALAIGAFFLLGAFLGRISRESAAITGLKLVLAGLFCLVIVYLIT